MTIFDDEGSSTRAFLDTGTLASPKASLVLVIGPSSSSEE